jgi:multimeric flavodoxin WrbA
MYVLGLQGSPRKGGNTDFLLTAFLKEIERLGGTTRVIEVDRKRIVPCKEYIVCEKKGYCPIDDDMTHEIYPLLRRADIIVMATPVFFYSTTAQLKALIDRSQTLWARKYRLNLEDPARKQRRGYLLAVGATKGKNLFEGIALTAKYFFDAVGAHYEGSLTYRGIESRGDMEKHPSVIEDVRRAVEQLTAPFAQRKRILFAGRSDACRSQMAAAFAQIYGGEKIEAVSGGALPATKIEPLVVEAMGENRIDMAFRVPKTIDAALSEGTPERVISIGAGADLSPFPHATCEDWAMPEPDGGSLVSIRSLRDEIEKKIRRLVAEI